jgi:hypothetical protein
VAQKRKKKKKKSDNASGGGGNTMGSFRSGFKGIVGAGGKKKKKDSMLSTILGYVLIAAALGLLIYRYLQR